MNCVVRVVVVVVVVGRVAASVAAAVFVVELSLCSAHNSWRIPCLGAPAVLAQSQRLCSLLHGKTLQSPLLLPFLYQRTPFLMTMM